MAKTEILDLLKLDIEDIKGLIKYENYGKKHSIIKKQAKAIRLNLQDHLEEFIQNQ